MRRRRSSGASASRANTGSLIRAHQSRTWETAASGSTVTFHQATIEAVVPYRTRREWLHILEASAGSEFFRRRMQIEILPILCLCYESTTCCLVLNSPHGSVVRLPAKGAWANQWAGLGREARVLFCLRRGLFRREKLNPGGSCGAMYLKMAADQTLNVAPSSQFLLRAVRIPFVCRSHPTAGADQGSVTIQHPFEDPSATHGDQGCQATSEGDEEGKGVPRHL